MKILLQNYDKINWKDETSHFSDVIKDFANNFLGIIGCKAFFLTLLENMNRANFCIAN
jgi:hypothetical protein